jgi:hypothetical protein
LKAHGKEHQTTRCKMKTRSNAKRKKKDSIEDDDDDNPDVDSLMIATNHLTSLFNQQTINLSKMLHAEIKAVPWSTLSLMFIYHQIKI